MSWIFALTFSMRVPAMRAAARADHARSVRTRSLERCQVEDSQSAEAQAEPRKALIRLAKFNHLLNKMGPPAAWYHAWLGFYHFTGSLNLMLTEPPVARRQTLISVQAADQAARDPAGNGAVHRGGDTVLQ